MPHVRIKLPQQIVALVEEGVLCTHIGEELYRGRRRRGGREGEGERGRETGREGEGREGGKEVERERGRERNRQGGSGGE